MVPVTTRFLTFGHSPNYLIERRINRSSCEFKHPCQLPWGESEWRLVKLWIDTGAKPGKAQPLVANSTWNRLPPSIANRSYAVAMTADPQYVATAWGNRIAIHHVPTERLVGYLSDPDVVKMGIYGDRPVAHLDFVRRLSRGRWKLDSESRATSSP